MTLTLDQLTCIRGQRLLFEGLSFKLESGEVLLVRGANGSGKSSLLRVIAGLLKPAEGSIVLSTATDDAPMQTQLHYLGHADGLKPPMTVTEMLTFWRALLEGDGDLAAALDAWHLQTLADLPCGVLSAGQKRRVALAQLSLTGRPLWLLDEPTAPLDEAGVALAVNAIKAHAGRGGMTIIATHRPLDLPGARELDLSALQVPA